MTTLKQFEANRLNALKSTGPRTEEGKRRSRCNAIRHGLTAETVIVGLEDPEDYGAFEATVIADYDARTGTCPSPGEHPVATSSRNGNRNFTLSIRDEAIHPIPIGSIEPCGGQPIAVRRLS